MPRRQSPLLQIRSEFVVIALLLLAPLLFQKARTQESVLEVAAPAMIYALTQD